MGESAGPAGSPTTREAVADLARRLHVAEDAIAVERVEEVTWNDGSLGCAEPGSMYTQALVAGSRITLSVGDRLSTKARKKLQKEHDGVVEDYPADWPAGCLPG